MSESLTTALERSNQPEEVLTIQALVERQKPAIRALLGSDEQTERLARLALTVFRHDETLRECDPYSMLGAMMLSAQLNLEPGPLGHVYFVPFKRQVQFIVGYRGFVELAYRSGQVKDISASLVHEGDAFEWREGTRPFLDHKPAGPRGERELIAAYAVARLKTGGTVFRVIYPEDWERARKASPAGSKNVGPWATDFAAMVLKTAYRRLDPKLPKTPAMAQAVQVDEHSARWVEGATDGELEIVEGGDDA